jgi:CRISPR/Cas system-associated endonuclease Cas1
MVENVNVYSGANITSPCIYRMIDSGILITWFNSSNQIIGCAENIHSINSELMEKQILFREKEDLCLELSKKIINAKLINATVILRRFNRNRDKLKHIKVL